MQKIKHNSCSQLAYDFIRKIRCPMCIALKSIKKDKIKCLSSIALWVWGQDDDDGVVKVTGADKPECGSKQRPRSGIWIV